MVLKEDQERIKTLLKDTITLLCRNGLTFKTEFSIEALIGITLDKDDILLVNINEIIRTELGNKLAAAAEQSDQESVGDDWEDGSGDDVSPRGTPHSPSQKKRRKRHRSSGSQRNDGGGGGGHGDMSNTSFPDDSSTHSEPPVKRKSTLPNSRNSMKNENDDDSKDIVFIKEEVDTGDWSHTSQGPGHFPADLSGIPSQHQQEHFDNFLQGGSLVPVGAQQSSANLWSDMTGGPGSSMNQTMSPPGSKRSSTVTSNAAATPGDDSQQTLSSAALMQMPGFVDQMLGAARMSFAGMSPAALPHLLPSSSLINLSIPPNSVIPPIVTQAGNNPTENNGIPTETHQVTANERDQVHEEAEKGLIKVENDLDVNPAEDKTLNDPNIEAVASNVEVQHINVAPVPQFEVDEPEIDTFAGVILPTRKDFADHNFHASCPTCDKVFSTYQGFMRHIDQHRGRFSYFCDVCNRGFMTKDHLGNHMRGHTGQRLHCSCGANFRTHQAMRSHKKKEHKDYSVTHDEPLS